MKTVLNWLRFETDVVDLTVPTNLDSIDGGAPGLFIKDVDGLFMPGASTAKARSRSFADGSVLNLYRNFSGKVLNITFIVYAPDPNDISSIKNPMDALQELVLAPEVNITSDWNKVSYTAQIQSDVVKTTWDAPTGTFEVAMIFACKEAF